MEFTPEYTEYVKQWEQRKRDYVIEARKKYGAHLMIETGTCKGHMVAACLPVYPRIYSIELSDYYYEDSKNRFKDHPHVQLIHGDSAIELGKLLESIPQEPAVFWLDAHHSGGLTADGNPNPLSAELRAIMNRWAKGTILIDDQNLGPKEIDLWKKYWAGFQYFDNIIRIDIGEAQSRFAITPEIL